MSNPFLSINSLNSFLIKLLNQLQTFKNGSEYITNVDKLLRKTFIVSLLSGKYIIAVAGQQGAGKSTLIKELYDLGDEVVLTNQGQGETIPILIKESNNDNLNFYIHSVHQKGYEYSIVRTLITKEDFISKSHAYSLGELILEMEVPTKIFNSQNKHFLLLPGFQTKHDYLKDLTYSSLKAASTCLVLFFKGIYSHEENKQLLDELSANFQDVKPLYIITNTDKMDNNSTIFKETVIKDLKIPPDENDRVLFSGIPGPSNWKNDLINSLTKYSVIEQRHQFINLDNLYELTNEVTRIVVQMEKFIDREEISIDVKENKKVNNIINLFRRQTDAIRKDLSILLENKYNVYFNNCRIIIDSKLGADDYVILENIKDYFRNPIKIKNEFHELIEASLKEANPNSIDEEFIFTLNKIQNKWLKKHNLMKGHLIEDLSDIVDKTDNSKSIIDRKLLLSGINQNEEAHKDGIDNSGLKDLIYLFHPETQKDINVDFDKNLEDSIKLVPILAMEGLRVGSIMPTIYKKDTTDLFDSESSNHSLIKEYGENKKEVAIGVAILFGLDVIPDGDFDLFGLLHQNAASSSVGLASINWVLASIVGVAATLYLLDQLNKYQINKANVSQTVIENMKNYCISNYLKYYDIYMNEIEDILRELLRKRYGFQEKFAEVQNLYGTVYNIEQANNKIRKEINDIKGKMGKII